MEGESSTSVSTPQTSRVALLVNQLRNYERAPKGFMKSWQETQRAEACSTARIFLDEGEFPAWFAYFLTKNAAETQYHFHGKADCSRFITDLETECFASRKLLAAQVAAAIGPELAQKINSLYDRRIKPLQNGSMVHNSKKRRYRDDCPSPSLATPRSQTTTPNDAPQLSLNHHAPDQASPCPSVDLSYCIAENEHVLVNASLADATRLFPRDLSNSIKRNQDPTNGSNMAAAVSMTFPNAPFMEKFGCQMALEVTEDKVQHLARELFEVRLETRAGLRYVYFAGGCSKILPNPKFTLQGCRHHVILSTFGSDISNAIAASPLYQDEIRQCRDSTDCVSMVISHQAHEGALIFVSLGLWEGIQIRKKLYV
ncbi:hypothetical protein HIM_11613 [Hirsutella minnesotensis 3608]|uniref:Uncharacterized protein n=1 Tax=Hirsutella minnesotensis 3608 TaxID=1043627 RepID=A0A0F7ZWH8_9HYPO|nr:hypothetical protein HIM_11613 [Hirsutella minnesotensis 3608]